MEYIQAKTILQKASHGEEWFGIDYNMNLYKGCCHKCIYCDSRSSCYQVEDFDRVRAKENEIEILNQELKSKRKKGVIGLSDAGLFVGTLLTPIIPFITDSEENIRKVIRLSAENGAKFVSSMGGVTLRENQREYFYEQLDKSFPKLKEKYINTYGNNYFCYPLNKNLADVFKEECEKYGLLYKMNDIIKAYKKENKDFEQLTFLKNYINK